MCSFVFVNLTQAKNQLGRGSLTWETASLRLFCCMCVCVWGGVRFLMFEVGRCSPLWVGLPLARWSLLAWGSWLSKPVSQLPWLPFMMGYNLYDATGPFSTSSCFWSWCLPGQQRSKPEDSGKKETGHYIDVVFLKVAYLIASSKHLIIETSVDVGGIWGTKISFIKTHRLEAFQ